MNDNDVIVQKGIDEKFCSSCGNIIKIKAEICPKCGVRQYAPVSERRIAAALLAFFLGFIGVHKFYLGKIGQGFLYLIFFWTLIPGVIAFIEFIIYITMSDEAFDEKFPKK